MDTYLEDNDLRIEPNIRTPKRRRPTEEVERIWYEYHASFSAAFVQDVLKYLNLPSGSTILDPWNGTGITTQVAHREGYRAIGIDISPVMMLVAKARHLDLNAIASIESVTDNIVERAQHSREFSKLRPQEPLLNWFGPKSALNLRRLERSIQTLLINEESYEPLYFRDDYSTVPDLAAFFYVALFRVLRQAISPFATSNPTWFKASVPAGNKLRLPVDRLTHAFKREVRMMAAALQTFSLPLETEAVPEVKIVRGTAVRLPIEMGYADAVISSPPYCTRIDYAIATLPELRLLGCTDEALKSLRDQMLGTPTMSGNGYRAIPSERLEGWGPTAANFLAAVSRHGSKASSTYYLRYFLQYFHSAERSLQEISRVLEAGSPCILVVQDSHYKQVRLDLARVFEEMASNLSLQPEVRIDYPNGNSLAQINRGARKYRKSLAALESVLVLHKR